MRAHTQPALFAAFSGVNKFSQPMPAIHPLQCPIINRFQAQLQPHVGLARKLADKIENIIGQAVRPGTDRETDDSWKIQGFAVESFQFCCAVVGVRITLKVRDEALCPVTFADSRRALLELLSYRGPRPVILRRVTGIVTGSVRVCLFL